MNKIMPVYYSEYGRYINRFRAMPFKIDALKPIERRSLICLFQIASGKKHVKSAKVVGHIIGTLHPHSDQSCYGSLAQLVHQGLANGQGNWGSASFKTETDFLPSAQRYTEIKLEDWVKELCFKYLDYVPWQNYEFENEPLYLPCPVPIGLIGHGVITGISFYRSLIPKYNLKDLGKRLVYLLEDDKTSDFLPIKPNIKNCYLDSQECEDILTKGVGSVNMKPFGEITGKIIKIQGKIPNSSFDPLREAIEDGDLELTVIDGSKYDKYDIGLECRKRNIDIQDLADNIWDKYLNKTLNFNCLFCDENGAIDTIGLDNIILNSYQYWKLAVLNKKIEDYNKTYHKRFDMFVISIIRYLFEEFKYNKVSDLVTKFNEITNQNQASIDIEVYENDKWIPKEFICTSNDIIRVCRERNINTLIEKDLDTQKVDNDLLNLKNIVNNNDKDCYDYLKNIS